MLWISKLNRTNEVLRTAGFPALSLEARKLDRNRWHHACGVWKKAGVKIENGKAFIFSQATFWDCTRVNTLLLNFTMLFMIVESLPTDLLASPYRSCRLLQWLSLIAEETLVVCSSWSLVPAGLYAGPSWQCLDLRAFLWFCVILSAKTGSILGPHSDKNGSRAYLIYCAGVVS